MERVACGGEKWLQKVYGEGVPIRKVPIKNFRPDQMGLQKANLYYLDFSLKTGFKVEASF